MYNPEAAMQLARLLRGIVRDRRDCKAGHPTVRRSPIEPGGGTPPGFALVQNCNKSVKEKIAKME